MPDAEPQPTRPIDQEEIRFQSQDALRAILDNRPAIISLLSAILDDLIKQELKHSYESYWITCRMLKRLRSYRVITK